MKKFLVGYLALITLNLYADPVCPTCEVIREYNKEHPGKYEYFEDYQKANKEQTAAQEKSNVPQK
jgi:hypothetical protein